MLIAIGAVAVFIARDYPFGTALRRGAGFFPVVLGVVLMLFGLTFALRGLRDSARIEGNWSLRALIVLPLAFVAFGVLMEHAGFVPAMLALTAGSAAAGPEFRIGEVLALSVLLTVMCVALFIWALGLPYPLIVGMCSRADVTPYGPVSQSHLRLRRRAVVAEPPLLPDRRIGRHLNRRAPWHRTARHHRDPVADHLQRRSRRCADHARRHLLRRAIWRPDHPHPGGFFPRDLVG